MGCQTRIGILCGNSPRSVFVANRLARTLPVAVILVERGRQLSWRALRRNLRPQVLAAKLYRRVQPLVFPPDANMARLLFPRGDVRFDRPELIEPVRHINAPTVVERLAGHRVSMLAVFGTSLLTNPRLFSLCPNAIFNLHGGLSPWYRGSDSTFWALFHNEPQHIGCTVHRISRRIDAGELIAHACPALEPPVREISAFAAALALGADVFAQALARIRSGERLGVPQPPGGRLFLHSDRTWRHDLALRRRMVHEPQVSFPQRVTWYHQEVPEQSCAAGGSSGGVRTELVSGSQAQPI